MQNKTRTQEISALGHFLIQNSSGPVNDTCFYIYIYICDIPLYIYIYIYM